MNILQVATSDQGSGAERVARCLHGGYRAWGATSHIAVGHLYGEAGEDFLPIPNRESRGPWSRWWYNQRDRWANYRGKIRGAGRLSVTASWLGDADKWWDTQWGREDFQFPGTARLLELPGKPPDIVQCHNLHGAYFDLRQLPRLSAASTLILTLHDRWLFTGHCAQSLGCPRWETGCGSCPDLTLYPRLKRDGTAGNWSRKREIFRRTRAFVSAPSGWLLDQAKRSILAAGAVEFRVIPNGVDLEVFHPQGREEARGKLGIGHDEGMLLFAAHDAAVNPYKDFTTIRDAVALLRPTGKIRRIVFVALGSRDPRVENHGAVEIRHVAFDRNMERVATYLRAADLYLHAAVEDTFPNTVIEALACGTPVVATAVGGIPEQVNDLDGSRKEIATGALVPSKDPRAMAAAVHRLLEDETTRRLLAGNAAADAKVRFNLRHQVQAYLDWFSSILQTKAAPESRARRVY